MTAPICCLVIMGVAGSGKTTVGRAVAQRLGWEFIDADDHHSTANIAKMRRGDALNDHDRAPWLAELGAIIERHCTNGQPMVLACSALKRRYRDALHVTRTDVHIVDLHVPEAVLHDRLTQRSEHFATPALLASQLHNYEPLEPGEGTTLDGSKPVEDLVAHIVRIVAN